MSRRRPVDDGDELLARLGTLTAQARERAELQRSLLELAVALQRGMLPGDMPVTPGSTSPSSTRPPTTASTWAATGTTPSRCPTAA